jgi:hypothetical protein
MQEQKMTYAERVNAAAETYANSYNSYMDLPCEYKDTSSFLYEGKKYVAAQAEAIILKAWGTVEKYTDWLKNNNPTALHTQKYLLEHGYIEH